jgi:hypothetical protein
MKHRLSFISVMVVVALLTVFSYETWAMPGGGMGMGGPGGNKPPKKAIKACKDKNEGDTCSFRMKKETITGMCIALEDDSDKLVCAPEEGLLQQHHPQMIRPVADDDGTVYVVTVKPLDSSSGFESELVSIAADGTKTTLTLTGMVSQPVLSEDETVLAAASFKPEDETTIVYLVEVPFTQETVPVAAVLDGKFLSEPVMGDDKLYITTEVLSNSGSDTAPPERTSYLYTIAFDGSIKSKVEF